MVLVSYKLNNKISILQTKLSNRERHEARHVGEEAMPLDQHIEGGHGEREAGVEIRPASVHDFLKVAHDGQQFPLTPCKFYATMVADSSDSVSTIRFRLVKRFLRLEITGRLLESELML